MQHPLGSARKCRCRLLLRLHAAEGLARPHATTCLEGTPCAIRSTDYSVSPRVPEHSTCFTLLPRCMAFHSFLVSVIVQFKHKRAVLARVTKSVFYNHNGYLSPKSPVAGSSALGPRAPPGRPPAPPRPRPAAWEVGVLGLGAGGGDMSDMIHTCVYKKKRK